MNLDRIVTVESPSSELSSPGESSLTVLQAQRLVDDWINTLGVRYFGELTNLAQLTEEVGELARLLSRTCGEQSFRKGTEPDDVNAAIADEMADILFVLICLANQTNVDLADAFRRNIEKKTGRDADRHLSNAKLTASIDNANDRANPVGERPADASERS